MKSMLVFVAVAVAMCHALNEQQKYHDLDLEGIVADPAKLTSFANCFSEANLCDQQTLPFRDDFIEAIKTACRDCSQIQKHSLRRFLEGSSQKAPQAVQALVQQYDPQNQLFPALQANIANA